MSEWTPVNREAPKVVITVEYDRSRTSKYMLDNMQQRCTDINLYYRHSVLMMAYDDAFKGQVYGASTISGESLSDVALKIIETVSPEERQTIYEALYAQGCRINK